MVEVRKQPDRHWAGRGEGKRGRGGGRGGGWGLKLLLCGVERIQVSGNCDASDACFYLPPMLLCTSEDDTFDMYPHKDLDR